MRVEQLQSDGGGGAPGKLEIQVVRGRIWKDLDNICFSTCLFGRNSLTSLFNLERKTAPFFTVIVNGGCSVLEKVIANWRNAAKGQVAVVGEG